ncbi:hypothetical protein [Bacillus infantis]|uniref:hypothetical protein n=1 Tax=Bacillus infantis TaxID=324767 RepID=UPI003CE70CEE
MKCRDCKYWREVEGTERHEDIGGCTYSEGEANYYPMFLDEECNLKDEYRHKVIEELK